ncbi:hypothetical protein BDC45DRAFT_148338 [Circinella umbellata]|nr:hypothetical protein BDC45DRAFT_148338 [Circinella umbellata]
MRRLPNTGGDQQWTTVPYSRRGRRHSEPFHHHNHHNQQQQEEQQTRCDSIISTNTTFSHHPLEATFSQHQQQHDETNTEQIKHAVDGHLNSPKRVRSQSLPGHFNKPPLPHQQQQSNERRPLYSSHIPIPDAIHQIQQRKLFSGMLSVDSQDSSDAFVVACEELDNDDIYIYGSRNRNRALDGDYVAIELVDVDTMLSEKASKKQARRRSSLATATLHSIPEETAFGGERIKDSLIEQQKEKPKYCGKVVSILERPKRMLFSGTLSLERPSSTATPTTPTGLILPSLFQLPSPTTTQYNSSSHQQQYHKPSIIWLVPADKRLPLVAVPAKHAPYGFVKYHEEFRHRIFIGSIQRWPVTSLHPFGTIEREIGLMGELNVHSQALMADNHLKDYCEFTKGVLKSADAVEEEEEVSIKRRDLRDLPIFTVKDDQWQQEDPLIDHGFSIKMIKQQDADGLGELYEIGIHTIDVGSLIRPNTLLDREARDRGVTVQLVERQIPMLPPSFTNAHAELAPGKERAALSVLCRVTRSGKFIHSWVGKTIIKSDTHLENNKVPQDMLDACKTLQIKRIEQDGGDSLSMTYQKFQTSDSTGGYPESVVRIHRSDDHPLVLLKEAAILAGQEVAKKITSRLPEHALLYHQPKQLCYDSTTAKNHNKEVKEDYKRDPHNRPTYFCSGNMDITRYEHYPYAAPLYTVFSEPLHRYGCIAVQRQLHSVLDKSTSSIAKNKAINEDDDDNSNSNKRNIDMIDKLARHCNAKEYARDTAYEQSVFLYNAAYIYRQCLDKKQPFLIKEATVLSLQPSHHSIVVSIPDYVFLLLATVQ